MYHLLEGTARLDELARIESPALAQLEDETYAGLDCLEHGIILLEGAESWATRERGYLELPTESGPRRIYVEHDEREAPYALTPEGIEDKTLLISLTDDSNHIACAWVRVPDETTLVGVGIDLVAPRDFERQIGTRKRKSINELLFSEQERALMSQLGCPSTTMGYATLFGAKEASFKATAAPLRRWYDTHDDQLLFEVRHFVMTEPGIERGIARNGAAQKAMDRMGIATIVLHHAIVEGLALVTAVALADSH